MSRRGRLKPLGELMVDVLRHTRAHRVREASAELEALWNRVAGRRFAGHTRVLGLKRGTLQVGVFSASARHELESFHREKLLEAIRAETPGSKVRALKFVPFPSELR